jgi:hypothetical protein
MTAAPDLTVWISEAGGYTNINWPAWDRAVIEQQLQRRERLLKDQAVSLAMWRRRTKP